MNLSPLANGTFEENMVALQMRFPALANSLHTIQKERVVRPISENAEAFLLEIQTKDQTIRYSILKRWNEAGETNRSQQWMIFLGIDAAAAALHRENANPFSGPVVVLEPDLNYFLCLLASHSLSPLFSLPGLSLFLGAQAAQQFFHSLQNDLAPYFFYSFDFSLSVSTRAEMKLQGEPLCNSLNQVFHQSRRKLAELLQAAQIHYTRQPIPQNKRVLIAVPAVSSWLMLARGFAWGFQQMGYQVIPHYSVYPPTLYEKLRGLWLLYNSQPDFILTISHSAEQMLPGLESLPVPRIAWYVDHPHHLSPRKHGPYDRIYFSWEDFADGLSDCGGDLQTELQCGGYPITCAYREELACDVGFVGSVHSNSAIRSQIPKELLSRFDALVQEKIRNQRLTTETLLEQFAIAPPDVEILVSAVRARIQLNHPDLALLNMFIHMEAFRVYRLECLMELQGYPLKIFGNTDWETLLKDTPIEGSYQGRGLTEQECYDFYRSAKISLSLHPIFRHIGPTSRDIFIPMCGGFALSDLHIQAGERTTDFFEPAKEIALFNGPQNIRRQVEHYLNHPDERRQIIEAAQARIMREHSFRQRAEKIVNDLLLQE